jgi:uncharacterized protein (DUF885 family)
VILGCGFVLDAGIHAFGWTRERALRYVSQTGLSKEAAEDTIDRAIAQPGQLPSYELGGMEIWRLREKISARLGERFSQREFHQRVLEAEPLPLSVLRERILGRGE